MKNEMTCLLSVYNNIYQLAYYLYITMLINLLISCIYIEFFAVEIMIHVTKSQYMPWQWQFVQS